MKPAVSSEGVNIYCPEDGRLSLFNSPYPAHRLFAGVDVYPNRGFGELAPSPVLGEVIETRQVRCSHAKDFVSSNRDHVILLRSLENPDRWVKVLHVEPTVEVGDVIEVGANLGRLLRSGFFDFWTDPHLHVEVREPSDPIRARGGFKFERVAKIGESTPAEDLSGHVVECRSEYSLVALEKGFKYGVPADVEGQPGLLDAGIPHYGWIGLHLERVPQVGGVVRLSGRKIGTVRFVHSNMCVAECCSPAFRLNGKPVQLSLYLYLFSVPLVKIVPHRPGGLRLKESEQVSLVIP